MADVASLAAAGAEEILAVDETTERLERDDPEAAARMRLRFHAGLGIEDAAESMRISPRTAALLWNCARGVSYRVLNPGP